MREIGLFLALLLVPFPTSAHIIAEVTPDDALARAQVVCNGTPLDVSRTNETVLLTRVNPPAVCNIWKARIKVLASFKGDAKGEIELRYPRVAPREGASLGDDESEHFDLKPGKRYRFYLNPTPDGKAYVTVLDKQYDDLSAVEPLDADESDSSPPLLEKEARNLADAYLKKVRPTTVPIEVQMARDYWIFSGRISDDATPNVWTANYWYFPPPRKNRPFQVDAAIYVRGDRTIDPLTWISAKPAMKPGEVTRADVGKSVRVDVAQVGNRLIRGELEKVTDAKIYLKDPRSEQDGKPVDGTYFKRDINAVWILDPEPK